MTNFLVGGFCWALGMMGAERVVQSETAWNAVSGFRQWCKDVRTVMHEDDKKPAKVIRGQVVDIHTRETLSAGVEVH